jgi:isopentenyl-diphosphate Delta-isomerase
MTDRVSQRKLEHLAVLRRDPATDRAKGHFDDIRLVHRALPELDLAAVAPAVEILGKRLSFPLLISSMTGGDDPKLRRANRNLAEAAQAAGVAMAVGSQRAMFSSAAARRSFALREVAPDCLLLANLGAVQLNCGFGLRECRAAVEALQADGLCLHLNPLQEAIQAEGDGNFAGLARKVGAVARGLSCPVVLKEVGCGLAPADVALAYSQGIRYFDVAGAGGTSWSRIEQQRGGRRGRGDDLGFRFQDWGIPTPTALRLLRPWRKKVTLFASGGIRTGIDMAKAMVLGARLCGVAGPFLAPALESAAAVRAEIERRRREFVTAMFLLGARTVADLWANDALLLPPPDGE